MSGPFDNFQQGLMTGQQFGANLRQRRNAREIGGMLQTGDYSGAAASAYGQGDIQTGMALQGQASQQAGQERQGQIVGALKTGDFDAAASFAQSAEELAQVQQFRASASEQEKAQAVQRAEQMAMVATAIQQLPPDQQFSAAQQYAQQFGIDPSQITPEMVSPQGLEALRMRALGLKEYLEFKQDERDASMPRYVPALGGFIMPPGSSPTMGQGGEQVLGSALPPGWTPQPRPNQPSPAPAAGGGERSQPVSVSFRSSQEAQSAIQQIVPGVRVTSGARDAANNRRVGGAPGSFHLQDRARDLVPPAGMSMAQLAAKMRQAGFRVLNEGDHIHVSW